MTGMKRMILGGAVLAAAIILVVAVARRGGGHDGDSDEVAPATRVHRPGHPATVEPAQGFNGVRLEQDDDPLGVEALEGQVIDEHDQPVAGARVVVDSLPMREAVTEADGGFSFAGMIARNYRLEAHKGDGAAGPVSTRLTTSSEPVVLRMRQAGRLEVTVVDRGNQPVVGALVELRGVAVLQAAAGSDGVAVLTGISAGTHVLKVAATGLASSFELVALAGAAGEVVKRRVVLGTGVTVAGTVVDPSGRPLEGARVTAAVAASFYDPSDPRLDAVVSDAKGRWQLGGLPQMTLRFRAVHPEFAPAVSEPISLVDGGGRDDLLIRLELGGSIAGQVVDQRGAPVPGARVQGTGDDARGGQLRRAHCDADGRFRMGGLPRTRVHMVADGDTATSTVTTVDLKQQPNRRDVVLRLELAGVIAGRVVTSSGEEVPEARVVAAPVPSEERRSTAEARLRGAASDVADAAGHFTLAGLPPGQYRVRAIRPGSSTELLQMKQGVTVDTGRNDVVIQVDDLTSIAGQVRFRSGGNPELFSVQLGGAAPRPFAGGDGRFRIDDVPAGKQYVTISGSELVALHREDVDLVAGKDNDLGVIEVDRGRRIHGRVIGPGGAGVAGAVIVIGPDLHGDGWSLTPPMREEAAKKQAISGADGSYSLGGIGPLDQVLAGERDGVGRSAVVTVPPGTADLTVDLRVEPFASLTGRMRVNGAPATGVVAVRPITAANMLLVVTTAGDGTYHFDRIGAGEYLAYGAPDRGEEGRRGASGKRITIHAGASETVDFDLETGSIAVTLRFTSPGDAVQYGYGFIVRLHGPVGALPTTIGQARKMLSEAGDAEVVEGMMVSGRQIEFTQVIPGDYTACVAPLTGAPDDPQAMAQMQATLLTSPCFCKPATVAAAPAKQTVTVEVAVP